MTKEEYLSKHKELVDLLGMDMFEKRIQAERDGLTVYQFGYIFALENRITELEKALHVADEEYMCATSQYYNEPVAPSSYDRWLSLAIDPPREEK